MKNRIQSGKVISTVFAAAISLLTSAGHAEIQLTLKNPFIEKYKNRTSIVAECVVDHSKGKPNPGSKDGDMHIASRCAKEVALPLVAEIMNAHDHMDAVQLSTTLESDGTKVMIAGAWRIWNEHGGDQVFKQGAAVAKAENTNPDHVFEIHPITMFGDIDVRAGLKPIPGYVPKQTEDAFNRYEKPDPRSCRANRLPQS